MKDKLLVAGILQGELIVRSVCIFVTYVLNLKKPGVCLCYPLAYHDNAVTTGVEINNITRHCIILLIHTLLSPNGRLLIIVGDDRKGNQDKTCRIWDVRNLSKSDTVLKGNLGPIQSIRYTSDGRFVAMAEPSDFVHVFDVKSG
uniref:Uncharacterized protein n=1 Tax=Solanum lycopersicum TaxID=4081 RepID=K4BRG3_SOLLC